MCRQYFESILGETISGLGYFRPEVYTGLGQTIRRFILGRVFSFYLKPYLIWKNFEVLVELK